MLAHADKYSKAFSVKAVVSDDIKKSRVSYEDFENGNYPQTDAWKYSSFWYQNFDEMALKTMLRQLISKWGIMSIDLQKAYESDNSMIDQNLNPSFVENENYVENQTNSTVENLESNDTIVINEDDPFNDK